MTERPTDHEATQASFSYVASLASIAVGVPLPIVNLLASLIFLLGSRRSSPFVRWHAVQAFLSQMLLFVTNSALVTWTVAVAFSDAELTWEYGVAAAVVGLLNLAEFIGTVQAAIRTRRGEDVRFPLLASLTDRILAGHPVSL